MAGASDVAHDLMTDIVCLLETSLVAHERRLDSIKQRVDDLHELIRESENGKRDISRGNSVIVSELHLMLERDARLFVVKLLIYIAYLTLAA
jgi:hypothetical protein